MAEHDELEVNLGVTSYRTHIVKRPVTHYHTGGLDFPISIEFEANGKKYEGWIREIDNGR